MNGPNRRSLSRLNSVSKNSSPRLLQRLNQAATQRRGDGRSFEIDDHTAEANTGHPSSKYAQPLLAAGLAMRRR
jgi:hypothetical protein